MVGRKRRIWIAEEAFRETNIREVFHIVQSRFGRSGKYVLLGIFTRELYPIVRGSNPYGVDPKKVVEGIKKMLSGKGFVVINRKKHVPVEDYLLSPIKKRSGGSISIFHVLGAAYILTQLADKDEVHIECPEGFTCELHPRVYEVGAEKALKEFYEILKNLYGEEKAREFVKQHKIIAGAKLFKNG